MATFILGCFINTISANENMLVINAASEKPLVRKVTYKPDNEGLSVRYVINSLRISDNSLIIEGLSSCDFKENNCCQREDIIFVPDDMDAIVTFRPASMKTIDVASKKLVVNSEPKTLKTTDSELSNCTYSEFHYRGHKFLRINICPVVKNAESKISIFDDLTYDITFTTKKDSKDNEWLKPIDIESDALMAFLLNPESLRNFYRAVCDY